MLLRAYKCDRCKDYLDLPPEATTEVRQDRFARDEGWLTSEARDLCLVCRAVESRGGRELPMPDAPAAPPVKPATVDEKAKP